MQATGPPDTPRAGDVRTAWASATQDGQQEWLQLKFPRAVKPVAVVVHETYNPGAVYRVASVSEIGIETVLWEGTDPTPPTADRGESRLRVAPAQPIDTVKIYIDSPRVRGWNEIDTVGLELADGTTVWPERATASSSYATGKGMSFTFESFLR